MRKFLIIERLIGIIVLAVIIVATYIYLAQLQFLNQSVNMPSQKTYTETNRLTLQAAQAVAVVSNCVKEGTLSDKALYNVETRTWWIELAPFVEKSGCGPACVVSEDSRTADINWRCTGLIAPQ